MILEEITPKHFGPFIGDSTLRIDRNVTVLTGPNDVGKSLALRAIEILCTDATLQSHEVNRYRVREYSGAWNKDPELLVVAKFLATDANTPEVNPGDRVTVERVLTSNQGVIKEVLHGENRVVTSRPFGKIKLTRLPLDSEIRQQIRLSEATPVEKSFLKMAFGKGFTYKQHMSQDEFDRSLRLKEGEEVLNQKIETFLPKSLQLKFQLTEVAGDPEKLGLSLVDLHGGFTPLGARGTGVQRLMNIMATLLNVDVKDNHIIIYDEPETSLHADAQHKLRTLLEQLASHPNIQVIYTTHSPAMINSFRPDCVRIIQREKVDGKAVSRFVNKAFLENYSQVRSSLGVCPSDSLLYAPITVVVEGITEILCIPLLLRKLANSPERIEKLELVLSQSHFLDGQGDSYEYMVRLAKSQNVLPIVFLDGDKRHDPSEVRKKHPEVPVITLPEKMEIEDLIPQSRYFEAMIEVLKLNSLEATETAFETWLQTAGPVSLKMFTKRIERWLVDQFDVSLDKARVLRRAVELCVVEDIKCKELYDLQNEMFRLAGLTSSV